MKYLKVILTIIVILLTLLLVKNYIPESGVADTSKGKYTGYVMGNNFIILNITTGAYEHHKIFAQSLL